MKRMTGLAAILALAASGAAFAQDTMDADGDGAISFEEMLAAYPATTEEDFAKVDTDGDGAVSADELAAAQEAGLVPSEG